jgi:hypothetical protein
LWLGKPDAKGYGQIAIGGYCSIQILAHRLSWEIANGPIPDGDGYHGTCVLHRCDNPTCVNPVHLFLGTHADNMADMKAKGRANGGPGPLTLDIPFVNSFCDRHGHARYYFRRGTIRRALPGVPGSAVFEEAYAVLFAENKGRT